MKTEYSAGGVVYKKEDDDTYILFILDPYNIWALPKGHIEGKESREEAAVREVSEETGIPKENLKIKKYLEDMEFTFEFNNQKIHKIVNFYLIEAQSGQLIKPQLKEKIHKVRWVLIDKAIDFAGYENVKKLLKKSIKTI